MSCALGVSNHPAVGAQLLLESVDEVKLHMSFYLGPKDIDTEVEKFIKSNTQELGKDKWLCPLSGKKFKVCVDCASTKI